VNAMSSGSGLDAMARRALEEVRDGQVVGLGSGRAATAFVRALGDRVRAGLRVRGVPTSRATADLATKLGIPLATLEEAGAVDVDVDGADEVAPNLDLIKGLGGALVREKRVARASRRLIILVTPEKLVPALGTRGTLPVEVESARRQDCADQLAALGLHPEVRKVGEVPYVSDNGNPILDCRIGPVGDPQGLDRAILETPGVVGTGFFLGMADLVLVQDGDAVRALGRA